MPAVFACHKAVMRLTVFALVLAVGTGYVLGGRLARLAAVRIRLPWLAFAGIALQLAPVAGTAGYVVLLASFAMLLAFTGLNIRAAGFVLIAVGLVLNCAVIAANRGMPVTRSALVSSGQASLYEDLLRNGGTKHHLATDDELFPFLGDVIPIGPPVRQAVSIGDLWVYAGGFWFIVAGMRRRRAVPSASHAPIAEASR